MALPEMMASKAAVFFVLLAVLASLVCVPQAVAWDNLLQNPGFEEGTDGWEYSGGTFFTMSNPRSGNLAAVFIASEPEGWIYQTVPVSAGASYAFRGWVFKNSIHDAVVFLQMSWYESEDGSGSEIDCHESDSLTIDPPNYWFLTTGTHTAPANAHSATVKGIVSLAEPSEPASAYFDDMIFIEVPPTPTPAPTPTCPPNLLLANPGFEEGTDPWLAPKGSLSITSEFVHDGTYAAEFTTDTHSASIYQTVPVRGGGSYTLCGWAISDDINIAAVFLRIQFHGGGMPPSRYDSDRLDGRAETYRVISLSAEAPPGADSARVEAIVLLATPQSVTVYFDDLSFTGPPPTTPTPSPTQIPTPTATTPPTPGATPSPAPAGTTADRGDILINEVQYNPPQTGPDADFEWVELFNATDETIYMEGWTITDNRDSDLIPSITLSPSDHAVIAATTEFYANFGDFEGNIVFLDDPIGNGLSNDEDCLNLEDSAGNIIDDLCYGAPDLAVAQGHSLERSPAGGEFVDNAQPTPGRGLAPSSTPTPAETPIQTATPTVSATEAPTATPSLSPTPEDTAPPPASAFSGAALRAVVIVLGIAFLGIVFWLTRRRGR